MENYTDEELLVLIALLGRASNGSINNSIGYFDDCVYYTKGDNYREPFMDGFKTPADDLYNRLLHESNKRGILKWAEDEWL